MRRIPFILQAADGTKIFTVKWLPDMDDDVIASLLIIHGMAEHKERYAATAEYMTVRGVAVYALDLRGHGESITGNGLPEGFLAETDGWDKTVDDVHLVREQINTEYPGVPLFLLGHSMGSFVARTYIMKHGKGIRGSILTGTAGADPLLFAFGRIIAWIEGHRSGYSAPSPLLDKLSLGSYNKAFRPNRTSHDWLSRDHAIVDQYIEDKLCGFVCSAGLYADMFHGLSYINSQKNISRIPSDLSVLLIAGTADPLSKGGKALPGIQKAMKSSDVRDIEIKTVQGGRHEVLNETNRTEVWNDLWKWISERTA